MSKFFRHSTVTVLTFREDSGYSADEEFRVRSLGRGRWSVVREDGYRWTLSTSKLQRFFRPRCYADGYHSSGEPVIAYEEVSIQRDLWWRW